MLRSHLWCGFLIFTVSRLLNFSQNIECKFELQLWHDILSKTETKFQNCNYDMTYSQVWNQIPKSKDPILQGKCFSPTGLFLDSLVWSLSQNCNPFCMILLVALSVFLKNKSLKKNSSDLVLTDSYQVGLIVVFPMLTD